MPPISQGRFPKGRISTLWDAIVLQMQSDPTLDNGVDYWHIWTGEGDDLQPNEWETLPALKARPKGGQFTWADEGRLNGPFVVELDYAVQGTYVGDLIDMWEAIAGALSWYATSAANSSLTFGNYLIGLGCYNVTLSGPGLEPAPIAGNQGLAGRATITFSLNTQA